MKRLIFILVAVIFTTSAECQIKQEVISGGVGQSINGNISVNWTLGELIVPTGTKGNPKSANGFQQEMNTTAIYGNPDFPAKLKVFPNPAYKYINIQSEEPSEEEITISLLDSQGRIIKSDVIESAILVKQIDIQELPVGIYYLRIIRNKLVSVYKVVKL
jgi:hypothetical protein